MGNEQSTTNTILERLKSGLQHIDLAGMGIKEVPEINVEKYIILSLNLSRNCVKALPKNMKNLMSLMLSENDYAEIPTGVRNSIITYSALVSIDMSHNKLKSFSPAILHMKTLKELNLFDNKISELDFSQSQISVLNIGKNRFKIIPEMPETIEYISAEMNKIEILPPPYPRLLKLFLGHNCISEMIEDKYTITVSLDLSFNNLETLVNFKECFPCLGQLDLSHNKITKFPKLPTKLNELNISNNLLKSVPSNFGKLKYLWNLNISDNQIRKIPALPPLIATLLATGNNIATVESTGCRKLETMRLDRNSLIVMPKIIPNKIRQFKFACNKISSIDLSVISMKTTSLDLRSNNITSIPVDLFRAPSLQFLSLALNQITELPEGIDDSIVSDINLSMNPLIKFPRVPNQIEHLILVGCNLSSIPDSVAKLPELIELDISRNSISAIPFLPELISLRASQNMFSEVPPLSSTIENLDLSYNRLTNININLPHLKTLNISCNLINKQPNFVAPELTQLIMYGIPAKGTIDFALFPNLSFVSLANTPLTFKNPPGDGTSKFIHTGSSPSGAAFATRCGDDSMHADIIIARSSICGGYSILGHVLVEQDADIAVSFSDLLISQLEKIKLLDVDSIERVLKISQKTTKSRFARFLAHSSCFILYGNSSLFYAAFDRNTIFVASDDGEIRAADGGPWPHVGSTVSGDFFVFAVMPPTDVGIIELKEGDRWIIIANPMAADVLGMEVCAKICREAITSNDLAISLCNVAAALNKISNISIETLDLKCL